MTDKQETLQQMREPKSLWTIVMVLAAEYEQNSQNLRYDKYAYDKAVKDIEWARTEANKLRGNEACAAIYEQREREGGEAVAVDENDLAESAFWEFDAMHKGYGKYKNMPLSERDAFKHVASLLMSTKMNQPDRTAELEALAVDLNSALKDCIELTNSPLLFGKYMPLVQIAEEKL